jgi:hypothetical protein
VRERTDRMCAKSVSCASRQWAKQGLDVSTSQGCSTVLSVALQKDGFRIRLIGVLISYINGYNEGGDWNAACGKQEVTELTLYTLCILDIFIWV